MDHKVSKDMISSGMIPSGEKTQADLGRIQYGSAPSPSSLMDAYTSIYEHHKKDADGNTIPHEGEELNENLAGIAAKGLQMASRGARQVGKMAAQGSVKARQMQAQGGVKKAIGDKLQSAKKKTALTSGQKEALLGRTTAGKITRGVAALGAANIAGRMASGNGNSGNNRGLIPTKGFSYYDMNFHYVPDGDTLSEDLFDALKFVLTEEGYDNKTTMKIIASIDSDFINESLSEENLDEALPLLALAPLLAKGAAAAKAGLVAAKATKVGAAALKAGGAFKKGLMTAKAAKGATAGKNVAGGFANTFKAGSSAAKVGKAQKAGQMVRGAGAAMKNNPMNTALGVSMAPGLIPQGAPKPEATQRGVTSGKRTAGMRTMSLDLFDVVKGKLLDEGLTEEESNDVMTTLTLEEINEVIQLDEISSKLLMKSAKAAEVARGKAAVAGNKQLAIKKLKQGSKFFEKGVEKRRAEGKMGAGYKEGM